MTDTPARGERLDRDKLWQEHRKAHPAGVGYIDRERFESLLDEVETRLAPAPQPQGPEAVEREIERLRQQLQNSDGLLRSAVAEASAAKSIIAQHNLCHDLHGKVGPREFADGCSAEQRKLYGCAPDADALAEARLALERLLTFVERLSVKSIDASRGLNDCFVCLEVWAGGYESQQDGIDKARAGIEQLKQQALAAIAEKGATDAKA